MPGSRMSQTITSGLCRRAISTPSAPLAASLTTNARVAQQIAEEVARDLVVVDHQQAARLRRRAVGGQLGQQPLAIHRLAREGVGAERPGLLGIVDPGDDQDRDVAGRRILTLELGQEAPGVLGPEHDVEDDDAGPQRLGGSAAPPRCSAPARAGTACRAAVPGRRASSPGSSSTIRTGSRERIGLPLGSAPRRAPATGTASAGW